MRKVLSADNVFANTGTKQKHETVWRLDQAALADAQSERQRARASVPPLGFHHPDLPLPPELGGPARAYGAGGNGGGGGGESQDTGHAEETHLSSSNLAIMQQMQAAMAAAGAAATMPMLPAAMEGGAVLPAPGELSLSSLQQFMEAQAHLEAQHAQQGQQGQQQEVNLQQVQAAMIAAHQEAAAMQRQEQMRQQEQQ